MKSDEKVCSLEEYFLSRDIDLTKDKQSLLEDDNLLNIAATAWGANQDGIQAVIEDRMQKIRHEIIFSCTPYELIPLREKLVVLAQLLEDFENAHIENTKRVQKNAEESEEGETKDTKDEEVDNEVNI